MAEFTRELIFGKRPVHRASPKNGQSNWYYLDPRGANTFSDMKQIDVESENSPNPYANEIQNYLYKSDEYNYRQLYGDTPPTMPNDSKGIFEHFSDNIGNIAQKLSLDKVANSLYNLGYDGGERLGYTQSNKANYENKSSVGLAQAENQRLTPMPISDVNKHQYVSCIGSYDGPISAGIIAGAGIIKEIYDLKEKINDKKYGSNWDIIQDSLKDLKNNAIGIAKGLSVDDIEKCNYLLPKEARRR